MGPFPSLFPVRAKLGTCIDRSMWLKCLYIFRDIDHVMAFNESDIGQQLLEGLRQELGVRAIGASTFGD